jgi:RNA polymerase subunit RPABC4/transcription elongation factor Spt4
MLNSDSNETKECPGCAIEVDRDAEVCPICGYEFPEESAAMKWAAWIMIVLILLWLLF